MAQAKQTFNRSRESGKTKAEKLRLSEHALREAHAQLARSEERWRSVFENSVIGVALTDPNGQFIATNPAYQAMPGYTEEELQKLRSLDITLEEYRDHNWALVEELLAGSAGNFKSISSIGERTAVWSGCETAYPSWPAPNECRDSLWRFPRTSLSANNRRRHSW